MVESPEKVLRIPTPPVFATPSEERRNRKERLAAAVEAGRQTYREEKGRSGEKPV